MKFVNTALAFIAFLALSTTMATAQSVQESVEEENRKLRETMEEAADFVKDVTFNEDDVKSMIALMGELDTLSISGEGVNEGWDEIEEDDDEVIDFKAILADAEYRSWARSRGLDPDTWMKKLLRFQLMTAKVSAAEYAPEGAAQFEAQLAQIEAQREQMGEEAYQQMMAAIEAGSAAMSGVAAAYKEIPDPTPSERALIERYADQFTEY